jgi:hypothetical protein
MKRLFVIRIGVVIESHSGNPDASWGDTNVFEDAVMEIEQQYENEFSVIDIRDVRLLNESEYNVQALASLIEIPIPTKQEGT